jgi:hypothetical protein
LAGVTEDLVRLVDLKLHVPHITGHCWKNGLPSTTATVPVVAQ